MQGSCRSLMKALMKQLKITVEALQNWKSSALGGMSLIYFTKFMRFLWGREREIAMLSLGSDEIIWHCTLSSLVLPEPLQCVFGVLQEKNKQITWKPSSDKIQCLSDRSWLRAPRFFNNWDLGSRQSWACPAVSSLAGEAGFVWDGAESEQPCSQTFPPGVGVPMLLESAPLSLCGVCCLPLGAVSPHCLSKLLWAAESSLLCSFLPSPALQNSQLNPSPGSLPPCFPSAGGL